VEHLENCVALDLEVDRYADSLANADLVARVPSCPEWNVRDLTEHLGTVHRWAERLVQSRAIRRIPLAETDVGDVDINAEWLRAGGHTLSATLRAADPDQPMWAWGADQHVRFWSRRQLHETLVHRIDLELAVGTASRVDPAVAVDAVDEFFDNLKSDPDVNVSTRPSHPEGERLRFRAMGTSSAWNVELLPEGYRFVDGLDEPGAEVSGEPAELLALVLRRRALDECTVHVDGEESLVAHWLASTAFL
jgi:uncharacterized protein (TIGR03083 family)